MRIRNKELRARRQRKEQRVKEIIRDLKAGKGKVEKVKSTPAAEAVVETKAKAPAKAKAESKPKAPTKPKADKAKAESKAPAKPKAKKSEGE